jgi:hypothetical protein
MAVGLSLEVWRVLGRHDEVFRDDGSDQEGPEASERPGEMVI